MTLAGVLAVASGRTAVRQHTTGKLARAGTSDCGSFAW